MALNPLTLTVTAGIQDRPFKSAINGQTAGSKIELGNGSAPGFGVAGGFVMNLGLPYDLNVVELTERLPSGEARTSRILVTAVTELSVRAQAEASTSMVRGFHTAPVAQSDGSLSYSIFVEDAVGATVALAVGGGTPAPTPTLGTLSLSTALQSGTAVSGNILGATTGSTIVGNIPGITINGSLRTYSGTPTGGAQTITNGLVETLAGAIGSPRSSSITIAAVQVSLGALTLSASTGTVGTAQTVNILGATVGSVITGSVPDGMTLSSSGRTIAGTPTTAGGYTFGLVETLAGATGSPRTSNVTLTIAASGSLPATPQPSTMPSLVDNGDGTFTATPASGWPAGTVVSAKSKGSDSQPVTGLSGNNFSKVTGDIGTFVDYQETGTLAGYAPTTVRSNGFPIGVGLSPILHFDHNGTTDRPLYVAYPELVAKSSIPSANSAVGQCYAAGTTDDNYIVFNGSGAGYFAAVDAISPQFHMTKYQNAGDSPFAYDITDANNFRSCEKVDTNFFRLYETVNGVKTDFGSGFNVGASTGTNADAFDRTGTSLYFTRGGVKFGPFPQAAPSSTLPVTGVCGFATSSGYANFFNAGIDAATAPMQVASASIDSLGHVHIVGSTSGFTASDIRARIYSLRGDLWQDFTIAAGTISGGQFDVTSSSLPGRASALLGQTVRLEVKAGNNAFVVPYALVVPDHVDAVPFDKALGVNGGGLTTDLATDFSWNVRLPDNTLRQIGTFPYGGYAQDPANYVNWSLDGSGGTVQRDQYNGLGGNSVGATIYEDSGMQFNTPVLVHAYIDWAPGVRVYQRNGGGYPSNFAHNTTTGRTTFDLNVGHNDIPLGIDISGMAPGTVMRPVIRDASAPTVSPMTAVYPPVSKGIRFLDTGKYNNPTNYTRTLTALPVRTTTTYLKRGGFEEQANDLRATGSTMAYAINAHIDDTAMVTAAANHWAANTPNVLRTFVGTGNEWFNPTFAQGEDTRMGALRQGLGPLSATTATAVPETILDGQSTDIFPQVLVNCDSTGATGGNDQYLKTLVAFNAGDKVYRNVGGGFLVFQFTQNTPAGFVWSKYTGNDHMTVFYNNDQCTLAGKRFVSDLTVRNGNIWKARYAAAGKPAPETVLEGFAADFNFSVDFLNWNNNYLSIDRLSFGPYFNNGGAGAGGFMDWNDGTIWDATAKNLVATGTLSQVLDYVFNSLMTRGIDLCVQNALNWCSQLRAYNISKGRAPDAIKPIMYEFGDHDGFSGYNWDDNNKAAAFIQLFWSDARSYTLFLRYLQGLAQCGAPAFLYGIGPGGRPFNLVQNALDTATTGPSTNYYFKAMYDMQAIIAALP